jgi:hypothetical protein
MVGLCAWLMAADAGIFEKQKIRENEQGQKDEFTDQKNTSSSTRGLDLFSFFARVISLSHPVSAVGFMNTPVSVVREDAMPILCVNA